MTVPLPEQAEEATLHAMALRDLLERVTSGKLKRPEHEITRLQQRLAAAEDGAKTLAFVAERQQQRRASGAYR